MDVIQFVQWENNFKGKDFSVDIAVQIVPNCFRNHTEFEIGRIIIKCLNYLKEFSVTYELNLIIEKLYF